MYTGFLNGTLDPYNIFFNRTYINFNHKEKPVNIIISFFDIEIFKKISYNIVYIKTTFNKEILVTSDHAWYIVNKFNKKMYHFYLDLEMGDLYSNKSVDAEWACIFCLEKDIEKLDLLKTPCCKNIVHLDCMKKYWINNYNSSNKCSKKCPFCRKFICQVHCLTEQSGHWL